jgi:ribokinase
VGRVAVIGSTNIDLVAYAQRAPKAGETLQADDFAMHCGGKGANQAVAAAKLGADVMMVSRVGDDTFADTSLANYQRFGIDTTQVCKVSNTPSGIAQITVEASGENRILIVPGANAALMPDDLDVLEGELAQCALIVLQLEVPLPTVYRAIELGEALKVPVLLNPAPASPELDLAYACRCAYVVPNETELALLTGMPVGDRAAIQAAAQSLLDRGLQAVIVTMGGDGALHLCAEGATHVPAPPVAVVDTTGAGDAFVGCFSAQLASGQSEADALSAAVRYAALSVTAQGTHDAYADAAAFARWTP